MKELLKFIKEKSNEFKKLLFFTNLLKKTKKVLKIILNNVTIEFGNVTHLKIQHLFKNISIHNIMYTLFWLDIVYHNIVYLSSILMKIFLKFLILYKGG